MRIIFLIFFLNCGYVINAQDYFNRIIPFEFGNPTVSEIKEVNEDFYIPVIYPDSISTLIIAGNDNQSYYHFENFDFAREGLSKKDDDLFFFAKNRSKLKDLRIAKFSSIIDFDWNIEVETIGDFNFPGNSLILENKIYSCFSFDENEDRKLGINNTSTSGANIWTKYYENNIGYSYPVFYLERRVVY